MLSVTVRLCLILGQLELQDLFMKSFPATVSAVVEKEATVAANALPKLSAGCARYYGSLHIRWLEDKRRRHARLPASCDGFAPWLLSKHERRIVPYIPSLSSSS